MAAAVWLFICLGFRMWMVAPNVEGQAMGSPIAQRTGGSECKETRVPIYFYTVKLRYYPDTCVDVSIKLPPKQQQMKYNYIAVNLNEANETKSLQYTFRTQCTLTILGLEAPPVTVHFDPLDHLNEVTNEVDVRVQAAPPSKPKGKGKKKVDRQSVNIQVYGVHADVVWKVYNSAYNNGVFHLDCDDDDDDSTEESGEAESTEGPVSTQSVTQSTGDPESTQSITQTTQSTQSTEDSASTTMGTTQLPTSSQEPGDHLEDNNPMLLYSVGISSVLIVIVGVALFLYCLRKRRSDEENSWQPTQLSTVPASQYDEIILDDDDRDDSSPREQTRTGTGNDEGQLTQTGTGSDEGQLTQTGTGSDDGQYAHLVRDERRENGTVSRHDVYDHTTSSHRVITAVTENDTSEQGSEVYNQLQHHPEKQVVIGNVYDSTQ